MDRPKVHSIQDIAVASLVAELEGALVDYIEKFGPTDRARQALRHSSLWHSRQSVEPTPIDPTAR
jgi:hypothetical protein